MVVVQYMLQPGRPCNKRASCELIYFGALDSPQTAVVHEFLPVDVEAESVVA